MSNGNRTLFAVVNGDGTLARKCGAVSSMRIGGGQYEVIFNRNVRACAYAATIGLSGSVGASEPGEITVVGRNNNVSGIFLTTHDSSGTRADRGFHLTVHCCNNEDEDDNNDDDNDDDGNCKNNGKNNNS